METYRNLKKGTKIGLIVSAILCALVFLAQIPRLIDCIRQPAGMLIVRIIADFLITAAVFVYSFIGYKKPHGNMLKIVSVVFGAYLAFLSVLELNAPISISYISCGCYLVAALTVTYVAGRLHKIEKNRILLCLAGVCLLASAISSVIIFANAPDLPDSAFVRIVALVCGLTPLFIHAALGFAYVARYEEHKAAGLEDK